MPLDQSKLRGPDQATPAEQGFRRTAASPATGSLEPRDRSVHLGATWLGRGLCQFLVWAPLRDRLEVRLVDDGGRTLVMEKGPAGYHHALAEGVEPGSRYLYRIGEGAAARERPDPASRYQPEGVHGPSAVVDPAFEWHDSAWKGLPLESYVFYELHTGTFSPEGTFDGAISHLDYLKDLGITAIEIMPVAQFPGRRNWGYDGAYMFAPQNSYGGPAGLKRLVDGAHRRRLAVVLDVVYNHLGPEGNYLSEYGPYFTDRYRTPWGAALNFDGPGSDDVRRFFVENALYWLTEFHIDALRLDAIHGIYDFSANPFLAELAAAVDRRSSELGRSLYLIAESDLNDARVVTPRELGGLGMHAQWSDDFHHAVHSLLTGECSGYYCDFGAVEHLARAWRDGFVYTGQYSAYRQRRHGNSPRHLAASQMVVFSQNHDQVGNRMHGQRLSQLVSFEALKLAAGAVLFSPYLPLLFMGQEYGETAPFLYFTDHSDPELIEAVRRGRREEFAAFTWRGEPPDPASAETFDMSRLSHELRQEGKHAALLAFYREVLRLRREVPALARLSKDDMAVYEAQAGGSEVAANRLLLVRRWAAGSEVFLALNFADRPARATVALPAGRWRKVLDSSEARWAGRVAAGDGATLAPAVLVSQGSAPVSVGPLALALYTRDDAGREPGSPEDPKGA